MRRRAPRGFRRQALADRSPEPRQRVHVAADHPAHHSDGQHRHEEPGENKCGRAIHEHDRREGSDGEKNEGESQSRQFSRKTFKRRARNCARAERPARRARNVITGLITLAIAVDAVEEGIDLPPVEP
jgi:hypothetical protein